MTSTVVLLHHYTSSTHCMHDQITNAVTCTLYIYGKDM